MNDLTGIQQGGHISSSSPNDLVLDHSIYSDDLSGFDISESQKKELLETLWSIMRLFVEFGYSVDVGGQAVVEIFNRAARGDDSCGG